MKNILSGEPKAFLRVLSCCALFFLCHTTLLQAQKTGKLYNRWQKNFLSIANGKAVSAATTSDSWIFENTGEGSFVRIKNSSTGQYLHNQNSILEAGNAPAGWWSAQWTIEPVDGHFRIKNRWTNTYIFNEKGTLEIGSIQPGWFSAQWILSDNRPNPNPIPTADMCWAASSPRGAGTIPNQCPPNQELDGGLCYPKCNAGYKGVGPVCWAVCPTGFRDDGGFCAKPAPYGRGAGYPWKFGDGLNLDNAKKRCEKDNSAGCEKSGEIMYPKCKTNFHAVGCCVCSPDCPAGFKDIGVSCTKPSYGRGVGKIPTGCSDGKVNQGGLCYRPCEAGYKGVGPVCWAEACPTVFPVRCAAGCAKSSNACFSSIANQTMSVLEFAGNIAGLVLTGGGSNAAKTAGKVVAKTTIKQALIRKSKEMGKELAESAAENAASVFYDAQTTGEFSWEDLDPTGIANVVKAFNQPLCKDFR